MIKFQIRGTEYTIYQNVETVCLFGSIIRGDFDEFSDIDILIVIDDCDDILFFESKKLIENELGLPAHWISLYRKSTIQELRDYGSYFLWHVKNEGKILYSKTGFIERILNSIKEYTKVRSDLECYLVVCNDIRKSIQMDNLTFSYELSLLASLARNTCIAITYLCGIKVFGRVSAVETCKNILGQDLPFSIDDYIDLYKFRIAYTRNIKGILPFQPSATYIRVWIDRVEDLIHQALIIENRRN